jgi:diguanylate cyclase (GGDEF)-like protein
MDLTSSQSDLSNHANTIHDNEQWISRRLIQEHFTGVRTSVIANSFNICLLAFVYWNDVPRWQILTAISILVGLVAWRYSISKTYDKFQISKQDTKHLIRNVAINAAGIGAFWGATIVILMQHSSTSQQMLCAIIGAGTMSGGALTYRTVPKAAYFFVGFCSIGTLICLIQQNTTASIAASFLVICFTILLFNNIRYTEKNIRLRHKRELDLRDSSETINMLLADFTEQGSDWILEMDRQSTLINPSMQFANAARRPLEAMQNLRLLDVIENGKEHDELLGHLIAGRAFRNQHVCVSIGKERLWWSISARPISGDSNLYRGVISDISAQRQAEEKVSYMAHFDSLTDLPNRFQFNQRLINALKDKSSGTGIMYLDLDQFKIINDTLGHSYGDLLLKNVARRLESCVTRDEVVARLSGDEFAIIHPTNSVDELLEIGERIIASLSKPFRLEDHDIIVGASIGIAISPDHGDDPSILLRNADLALYEAKAQGRNRQIVFEIGMDEAAQLRRALELDLRGALGKQELCLHYQPLVQISDGATLGYEALIRWEHPERGIVMPDSFIPIAEDSGMIIPIGEWVIRQAIDDLMEWPDHMSVSINLSPAQMRSPSLITTLVNALAKTGAHPSRICIEITENVLMQDSEANLATLHKLHDLGIEIALDDFGTGYSSLNYLRSFPFDKIKIDRCFVNEIDSRPDCQAIVRSVVSLANSLGMTTTAEGVEREDQIEHLRREGCLQVQGYLFSKAVPQDHLTDLRKPTHSHAQKLVDIETKRQSNVTAVSNQIADENSLDQSRRAIM